MRYLIFEKCVLQVQQFHKNDHPSVHASMKFFEVLNMNLNKFNKFRLRENMIFKKFKQFRFENMAACTISCSYWYYGQCIIKWPDCLFWIAHESLTLNNITKGCLFLFSNHGTHHITSNNDMSCIKQLLQSQASCNCLLM